VCWRNDDNDIHFTAIFQDNTHKPDQNVSVLDFFRTLLELRMMEMAVTTAKLQSNRYHQQTNTHLLQAGSPSSHPTNSARVLNRKGFAFYGLAQPKLLSILSFHHLEGRVAKLPISPLMPVTHNDCWRNSNITSYARGNTICLCPMQVDNIFVFIRQWRCCSGITISSYLFTRWHLFQHDGFL